MIPAHLIVPDWSVLWHDLVVPEVSILEKVLRSILIYAFLIGGLRLAGKRELAQLNPFDLVVLLTLSNTVQNAIIGPDNSLLGGVVGAATLLLVNYAVVRYLYTHPKLEGALEGKPALLIDKGHLHRRTMGCELITRAELQAAARRQGFENLDGIERCVLEPGGTFTFTGSRPNLEEVRHRELLDRLAAIERALESRHA
jgi:uncharacterized membrane protein YcaP (DUF421 family)